MSLNGYQISSISYSVLEEQIAEHSMAEHFIIRYSFYWNPLSPSLVVTEQWNRNDYLPTYLLTYLPTYLYIEHLYSILDSYQRRQSPARWNLIQSFVWNKLCSILICPFLSSDRGRNCILYKENFIINLHWRLPPTLRWSNIILLSYLLTWNNQL